MAEVKYCPGCQKEVEVGVKVCPDCGYEFIVQEKKEVTNAVRKGELFDPTPAFLWTGMSFLIPIVGFILYFVFRKKWIARSEHCKDGAVIGIIVYALVAIFAFFFRKG